MTAAARAAAWVEIDLGALRANLRRIRDRVRPARVYVVCKGHGYGFDALRVARVAVQEGMPALACGDPRDALRLRDAGIDLPILLYGTTLADALPGLGARGITVTAHDTESLRACLDHRLPYALKLDAGFGRLGFDEDQLVAVIAQARSGAHRPRMAYAHLADPGDSTAIGSQTARYARMVATLEAAGWAGLERMVASSRVFIESPGHVLDAVNPGRAVYGLLEPPHDAMFDARPVLAAVRARIIGKRRVPRGTRLGYADSPVARETTIAVAAFGFANGYPRLPGGGRALVRGHEVPIVGPRHTEHTILDVTDVPQASVGDVATFLGSDGDARIDLAGLCALTGVHMLELAARLAAGSQVVEIDQTVATDAADPSGTSGASESRR